MGGLASNHLESSCSSMRYYIYNAPCIMVVDGAFYFFHENAPCVMVVNGAFYFSHDHAPCIMVVHGAF